MQKCILIIIVLTAALLGCRSTQKPVQVEKEPKKQVEVPKVDDSKKDAQKDQEVHQLVKTEEVVITARERKGKNIPLQSLQVLSKSFTT